MSARIQNERLKGHSLFHSSGAKRCSQPSCSLIFAGSPLRAVIVLGPGLDWC